MNKFLLYVIGVLFLSLVYLVPQLRKEKKERQRLESNQDALFSKVEYYKTENGRNVASVQSLQLTKSEVEKYNQDLVNDIEDLKVKLKRVQSLSKSHVETDFVFSVPISDSIIIDISIKDTLKLKKFNWSDYWVDVSGTIVRDSVNCRVQSRDSLIQVVHRIPKKFLFFKWGTKAIKQEIMSKNPHSKIHYTEYIELKK